MSELRNNSTFLFQAVVLKDKKKRWIRVENDDLLVFKKDGFTSLEYTIPLNDAEIVIEPEGKKKGVHITYIEKKKNKEKSQTTWLAVVPATGIIEEHLLHQVHFALKRTLTFGVPLQSLCRRERDRLLQCFSDLSLPPLDAIDGNCCLEFAYLPAVFKDCMISIYSTGFSQVGMFRVGGSTRLMEAEKAHYNAEPFWRLSFLSLPSDASDSSSNTAGGYCPRPDQAPTLDLEHLSTVTSLLKLFVRELPEPLLSWELYQGLLAVGEEYAGMDDPGSAEMAPLTARMRKLLQTLPRPSFHMLKHLFRLLVSVVARAEINSMTSHNMGVVFSPTLLKGHDESPIEALLNVTSSIGVVRLLIDSFLDIFGEIPNAVELQRDFHRTYLPHLAPAEEPAATADVTATADVPSLAVTTTADAAAAGADGTTGVAAPPMIFVENEEALGASTPAPAITVVGAEEEGEKEEEGERVGELEAVPSASLLPRSKPLLKAYSAKEVRSGEEPALRQRSRSFTSLLGRKNRSKSQKVAIIPEMNIPLTPELRRAVKILFDTPQSCGYDWVEMAVADDESAVTLQATTTIQSNDFSAHLSTLPRFFVYAAAVEKKTQFVFIMSIPDKVPFLLPGRYMAVYHPLVRQLEALGTKFYRRIEVKTGEQMTSQITEAATKDKERTPRPRHNTTQVTKQHPSQVQGSLAKVLVASSKSKKGKAKVVIPPSGAYG